MQAMHLHLSVVGSAVLGEDYHVHVVQYGDQESHTGEVRLERLNLPFPLEFL